MAGWIKIYRGITEMQGYFGENFNRPMCWIDLILLAETEPKDLWFKRVFKQHIFCIHEYKLHVVGMGEHSFYKCTKCGHIRKYDEP